MLPNEGLGWPPQKPRNVMGESSHLLLVESELTCVLTADCKDDMVGGCCRYCSYEKGGQA